MKEIILQLREQGLSYNEIARQANCSKGTVAYYCGENQKYKTAERRKLNRQGIVLRKDKEEKLCPCCDKPIKRNSSVYCSSACFKEHEYQTYIQSWKDGQESGLTDNGINLSRRIRRYLFEKHDSKCSRCGWNTKNPYTNSVILEVEHIDGNSLNNKEENLDLICPNCHSLTPTYKALNYGKGNRARLQHYKLI